MTAKTLDDFEALRFPPAAKALLFHLSRRGGGELGIAELAEACGMTKAMVANAGVFLARQGINKSKRTDIVSMDPESEWCSMFSKSGRKSATEEEAKALRILVGELRARIEVLQSEVSRLSVVEGELHRLNGQLATVQDERNRYQARVRLLEG